jgi:hypothetical protein
MSNINFTSPTAQLYLDDTSRLSARWMPLKSPESDASGAKPAVVDRTRTAAPPSIAVLSADPLIHLIRDFLTPVECLELSTIAGPLLERSIVVDAKVCTASSSIALIVLMHFVYVPKESNQAVQDGQSAANSRTSSSVFLDKSEFIWLHERIARLTGVPISAHEPPQITFYEPGEEYRQHFDAFDTTSGPGIECCQHGEAVDP